MEIKEAITKAKELNEERKKNLQVQVENLAKIDSEREEFKNGCEKKNKFLKDKDNVEGIKFLEENGAHFTLNHGRKDAIYLCSDGSFKLQRWGMYMGNDNIVGIKYSSVHETVSKLDLKELLVKQILTIGENRRVKPEDSFKEMFG